MFKVVHLVAPAFENVSKFHVAAAGFANNSHELQLSLVVAWCILDLVQMREHVIINRVDLTLNVVPKSWAVEQIRNLQWDQWSTVLHRLFYCASTQL